MGRTEAGIGHDRHEHDDDAWTQQSKGVRLESLQDDVERINGQMGEAIGEPLHHDDVHDIERGNGDQHHNEPLLRSQHDDDGNDDDGPALRLLLSDVLRRRGRRLHVHALHALRDVRTELSDVDDVDDIHQQHDDRRVRLPDDGGAPRGTTGMQRLRLLSRSGWRLEDRKLMHGAVRVP